MAGRRPARRFTHLFGAAIGARHVRSATRSPAASPTRATSSRSPGSLTRRIRERASSTTCALARSCRRSRARIVASGPTTTCSLTPGARQAPAADRRARRAAATTRWDDFRALRPLHAVHGALQRDRPAGDLAADVPGRRRPAARVQIVGPPAGEGLLLSLAAQLEAAHPWAERRPSARLVRAPEPPHSGGRWPTLGFSPGRGLRALLYRGRT